MPRQTWSQFILGYYICEACRIIDRDTGRVEIGHPCSACGAPGKRALSYFALPIPTVADLIGELHPLPDLDDDPTKEMPPIERSHQFALLVFFCTLGEVLLLHFLQHCMQRLSIPLSIQERLLNDNLYMKQRIERLFPPLTGLTWQEALSALKAESGQDYEPTASFFKEAADKRNQLLHLGNEWAVPPDMPERCFDETAPLIKLFVGLHNLVIADKPAVVGGDSGQPIAAA